LVGLAVMTLIPEGRFLLTSGRDALGVVGNL